MMATLGLENRYMQQVWITIFGIAAGGVGYLIATFWMRPILRYRDIKYQVASDLVFYANAIEMQKQDGSFREDTLQRKERNRRHAADLAAIYSDLPAWYQYYLLKKNENPQEASRDLIGLSNSSELEDAKEYIVNIKKHLRLP